MPWRLGARRPLCRGALRVGRAMTDPIIRAAVAADLPACAQIINDWLDATDWLPRTRNRDQIAAMFGPDLLTRRRVLVAEEGGVVLGYLSMTGEGDIPALYLSPAARGRGVGRRLMDRAKALSPTGITLRVWEPNSGAQRFYAREGFVEVPELRDEATEEGVPTLWLCWRGAVA